MAAMIKVQRTQDGVARVVLDRPAKRNALNTAMMEEFQAALLALSAWQELRVVVLSSSSPHVFVAGADIDEMAQLGVETAREFIGRVHRCCRAVMDCPVPVIACLAGDALGAGLELAAACDLRIAATPARFGMPEVRLGMPSVVEAALLPRLVGVGRARWLVYTGVLIDGRQALAWGLVEELVERDDLAAAIERTVAALLAGSPGAMRAQKQVCRGWDARTLDDAVAFSIDVFAGMWSGDEPNRRISEYRSSRVAERASRAQRQE